MYGMFAISYSQTVSRHAERAFRDVIEKQVLGQSSKILETLMQSREEFSIHVKDIKSNVLVIS
jgi:hypothetical protein